MTVARGALIGSGAGIPTAFATDFVAGSVGNALEQKITKGRVDLGESLISGAGLPGNARRDPRGKCGSPDPFDLAETLGDRRRSQGGVRHGGGGRSRTGESGGFSLGGLVKDMMIGGIVGGLGSAAFYGAGRAVDALKRHFAENAYFIRTPYGIAFQSNTKEARQVRRYIKQEGMVYRGGEFGNSKIADAQFWAPESPLTVGYAEKYGVAFGQMDYIIGGYVKGGSKFITRPAPGMRTNVGGAIEIVTPPNSVDLQYFYMLGE